MLDEDDDDVEEDVVDAAVDVAEETVVMANALLRADCQLPRGVLK